MIGQTSVSTESQVVAVVLEFGGCPPSEQDLAGVVIALHETIRIGPMPRIGPDAQHDTVEVAVGLVAEVRARAVEICGTVTRDAGEKVKRRRMPTELDDGTVDLMAECQAIGPVYELAAALNDDVSVNQLSFVGGHESLVVESVIGAIERGIDPVITSDEFRDISPAPPNSSHIARKDKI